MDKGYCKHGEFILTEGCAQCIAERRQAGITPQLDEMEDGLDQEGYTLAKADELPVGGLAEAARKAGADVTVVNIVASIDSANLQEAEPLVTLQTELKSGNYHGEPQSETTALITVKPESDSQVMAFYNQAVALREFAEARVITTNDDLEPANNDLVIIRKVKKGMEGMRKDYLKPFQDHVKETSEAYKALMEPIEQADKLNSDKILAFERDQRRIRQEQEEINRMRMEAAQKEMELNGELSESVNLVEVVPEAPKRIHTEMGTTGMRDVWKYEVTDINQVPREYLMINAGMLTPIVKASKGKITIPGIRIYNEPTLATNTR